ncbi:MAG: response regulator [bacterium]|nr:response regulator [bacterium]
MAESNAIRLNTFSLLLFLFLFLGLPVLFLGQTFNKKITQYNLDHWSQADGLPQNSVEIIIRTRDGYLWLGTHEGLVRFDGVRFEVFDKKKVKAFYNQRVQELFQDREGNLWIGFDDGGLSRMDSKDGTFKTYTREHGLSNNRVTAICENREGLWIGTNGGGLNRFKDNLFTRFTTIQGLAANIVNTICLDGDGNPWIGTNGGLNRLKRGRFATFTTSDGLPDNQVNALFFDGTGNLWIGTNAGLALMSNGSFKTYSTENGLSHNYITSICEDREKNLWVGTEGGGINRFKDGKFISFGSKQGLSNDFVQALYNDPEGSLWIGSRGGGLNRLKNEKFTAYTTKDGLASNSTLPIYEDLQGNIWIGTARGVNRMSRNRGNPNNYTLSTYLHQKVVLAIHQDLEGSMWFGSSMGVSRLKNGVMTNYTIKDGLSNNNVKVFCDDPGGDPSILWLGTFGSGLNRMELKSGKITAYSARNGLSNDFILCAQPDKEGNLWVGTNGGGVSRMNTENLTFTVYNTDSGLTSNIVRSLYFDKNGYLWIGTYGGGLNCLNMENGKLTAVTTAQGLFDDNIHQILEDNMGHFWMSCNKGIFRVMKKDLFRLARGEIQSLHCVSYDENDGMKNRECNGGFQPAGCKSSNGQLWFPTMGGVVMVDPESVENNPLPPPVIIEAISIDKKKRAASPSFKKEKLTLRPGIGQFEFYYTALSYLHPEQVLFQYKLEGFETEWNDVGTRRTAYYNNLKPGNYRFRVKACNSDGVWNITGDSFSFYLKPYFYQKWWVWPTGLLLLLLLVFMIFNLRVRRLVKHEEELARLVAQRTAELRKSNEVAQKEREIAQKEREIAQKERQTADAANRSKSEFLARMSHELRTPMNSILGFSEMLGDSPLNEEQSDYVNTINHSGEALLTILNDILDLSKIEAGKLSFESIDFSPAGTVESVRNLILPRIGNKELKLRYSIHDQVPAYVKQDEGRFRQVLINLMGNAVKFTEKGEIELAITVDKETGNRLKLHSAIRDSGIGIAPEKINSIFEVFQQGDGSITRKFGGTGLGLSICQQIAQHMGGEIKVESQPGKGSTFHFTAWVEKSTKAIENVAPTKGHNGGKNMCYRAPHENIFILLAEDNPINQKLARAMLTKAGYRVDVVDTGAKAVGAHFNHPGKYSLILMDIQMPTMDGRQATREIRKREQNSLPTQRIPIIAMTAESMTGDYEKSIRAGMDDYVAKPIKKELVLETIKKWL